MAELKDLSIWYRKIDRKWNQIKVLELSNNVSNSLAVGDEVEVQAVVMLGELKPVDVNVQLLIGRLDASGELVEAKKYSMNPIEDLDSGTHRYSVNVSFKGSGNHGFTVRVLPDYRLLLNPFEPGLVTWANNNL
jgi:starch phosphorylase